MTHAQAKRHACWLVARWIEGTVAADGAYHLAQEHRDDDASTAAVQQVADALSELCAELTRRGEFYTGTAP